MSGRYDFTIKQGSTFSMSINWKTKSGDVDLAGYRGRMQIRYNNLNGNVACDLNTENGGIQIDVFNNQIIIYITAEQTSNINIVPCVYDLEMYKIESMDAPVGTPYSEYVDRILEGKIKISGEVTR